MKNSLGKFANSITKYFGVEVHRYMPYLRAGSLRSMYDVCNQAKKCGMKITTIFDVGVATGTEGLYEAFSDSNFVLVEPLVEFSGDISRILEQYQGIHVNAAASDRNGKAIISINRNNLHGTSLLSTPNTNLNQRTVDLIRLDQIAKDIPLSGPYLIKADVQGAELQVVEGAQGILENTEMIILEVSFYEFSSGTPQFIDVVNFMKNLGFVVYDFIGGAIRPLDGALGQIDIAFVKEFGLLRQDHSYGSFP